MDKMLETTKLIAMLCVVLLFYYLAGCINYYSPVYQPADPSEPSAVTIYGRSASLLSGHLNLENAFGYDYMGWKSKAKLSSGYEGYGFRYSSTVTGEIKYYILDRYGKYPDVCSIYNGITTASTDEELERAFGDDCLKTDEYYAEIFLDDVEVDYGKINFPENFDYDSESSWDSWWEDIKAEHPET